ncbi:YvrJ family protein [Desemzia sp. RIT804]|uniref:YvrJ family protein n=1 Tax=Desemzia sp. RIT 804 TaxID=2810209 RepID=UPI00194ED3D3|nr:YvrJ family protein [Desemzia sp. RIT 804]MBM6614640.1 YvrJ family protein [Desemzia sp. RIT 804]
MEIEIQWWTSVIELVSNVGFPIFISLFLLQRMETKLDDVVKALHDLSTVIKSTPL